MEKFAGQIAKFKPEIVSCESEACAERLLGELNKLGAKSPRIELGEKGLIEVASF